MQINGGIRFCEQGMKASIRAMHVQSEILGMINDNVTGFDKVGYQRKEPVVSSFTELISITLIIIPVSGFSKSLNSLRGLTCSI